MTWTNRRSPARRPRWIPCLECLEDRVTPATVDVPGQFNALKHHGEAIGWTLPEAAGAPDPNIYDHYQGLARNPGAGTPVFYVTQKDNDDRGQPGGYLLTVRLDSRLNDGERLRSNLQRDGADTEDTAPPSNDTWISSLRFDGSLTVDGALLPSYIHPGGMAIIDDILFVAIDTPGQEDSGAPVGQILLFDLAQNGPEQPTAIQALPLTHGIDNLGVTKRSDGTYLIYANGAGGELIKFYTTNVTDLRDDALTLNELQNWSPGSAGNYEGNGEDWPTGSGAHQSSTFIRQADGSLFLLGMRHPGGLPFAGEDYADLYLVSPADPFNGPVTLTRLATRHFFAAADGAGRFANFGAAGTAYVSPSGELILYSTPHDDVDSPDTDFVRMGEYRHRDVSREDSPLRLPTANAGGSYVVELGKAVTLRGVAGRVGDQPWVELYDDHDFEDRSVVVDYQDRSRLELSDFNELDEFNDKLTSLRWRAPVGMDIYLYDDTGFEDRLIVLKGTGQTESIAHVGTQVVVPGLVEHPGKQAGDSLDFNDKTSSLQFVGSPRWPATMVWDLDGDGVFGETGAEALRGNELGSRPVFQAADPDEPSVDVTLRVTDQDGHVAMSTATVFIVPVPPTFVVTNTQNSGTGSLRQAILDANAAANEDGPDVIGFNLPANDPGHVYYRNDGVAGQVTLANVTVTTATDDATIADIDPDWAHSWWSIQPLTSLPTLTQPTIIDGYTQAGAQRNTLEVGSDAVLRVEVRGSSTAGGLDFQGGASTVSGLAMNRFTATGAWTIRFRIAGGNAVEGNFLGTDVSGTLDLGNVVGVQVLSSSANNRIGGVSPEARNVVSGNNTGILLSSGDGNIVQGNYIGTNAAGTADLGNTSHGVSVSSSNNTIGGTTPGSRNVIAGNNQDGISVPGDDNLIQGNFIGTDATGTIDLGNSRYGVLVQGSDVRIGGTDPAGRNIISGNNNSGIDVAGVNAIIQGNYIGTDVTGTQALGNTVAGVLVPQLGTNTLIGGGVAGAGNLISGNATGISIQAGNVAVGQGTKVQGNLIGTKANGVDPLGNTQHGVSISIPSGGALAGNHVIGGTTPGTGNVIAFNQLDGVFVTNSFNNAILGNAIFGNGGLGIDLNPNGVAANDAGDADTGANRLQNYPVLSGAVHSGGVTTVTGTLNSTVNATFRLEFFANTALDPTGFGEGRRYLGSSVVTTNAGGNVTFSVALASSAAVGEFVSATATDANNNTSEFSQGRLTAAVNVAPTARAGLDRSATEGTTVAFNGTDSFDPDGDLLTYSWTFGDGTNAAGATPTHVYADNGSYLVTLTINDGKGGSASDTLLVTVNNRPPTAVADSGITNEDQVIRIAVLANDSDVAGVLDPLQIASMTNGSKGTTALDTRGTAVTTDDEIVYTPNAGATGSDSFTYTISDGDGGTATALVTVQIRNLVDVAGRVFDDKGNDGVYEPDEGDTGIGGVTVQLFNEASEDPIAAAMTETDGTYLFDVNLPAGAYKIVAAQPAEFRDGRETAGNLGGTVDDTQGSNQITGIHVGEPGTTADAVDYLFAEIAVDATPPTSTVGSLPDVAPMTFTVTWSGDDGNGSGVAHYDVYVSDNEGPFALWQSAVTQTSADFAGENGHTYGFYSVATDNAGNRQATPASAQASTTVNTNAPSSSVGALPAYSLGTFTVSWFGQDVLGGAVAFYDVYAADNGGTFTLWQSATSSTSADFTGEDGHTYGFYSVATDTSGNRQATPAAVQASTTVDATAPTSSAASLPAFSPGTFTVTWSGDDGSGSGVAHYDVYVADDGGAFALWQSATIQTWATFDGVGGHTYAFYSVATDKVGNQQPTPTEGQASTTVIVFLSAEGGTASVVRGQPVAALTVATFTPADPNATTDDFSADIAWNDGSSSRSGTIVDNGDGTYRVVGDHVYDAEGSYAIQVTIQHTDGASIRVEGTATVTILALTADPTNPTRTTLLIGGTPGNDTILVAPADNQGNLKVTVNGSLQPGAFHPSVSVLVFGYAGDDILTLQKSVIARKAVKLLVPVVLDGGAGNDTVSAAGSRAATVVLGGAGADTLTGGAGRDILLGGLGVDSLRGGGGDDVLVGDRYRFEAGLDMVFALLAEWSRTDAGSTSATRRNHLLSGGGLNGAAVLNATTIEADEVDKLFGQGGKDWFLARHVPLALRDKVKDQVAGEVKTPLYAGTITLSGPGAVELDRRTGAAVQGTVTVTGTAAVPAGTLVTVATSLGRVVSADADPAFAGTQVVVAPNGSFSFSVQKPADLAGLLSLPGQAGIAPALTIQAISGAAATTVTDPVVLEFRLPTQWSLSFDYTQSPHPIAQFPFVSGLSNYGFVNAPPGIVGTDGTFRVALANGTYTVEVVVGNQNPISVFDPFSQTFVAASALSLGVSGFGGASTILAPGVPERLTFRATVLDGVLALTFHSFPLDPAHHVSPYYALFQLIVTPESPSASILNGPETVLDALSDWGG